MPREHALSLLAGGAFSLSAEAAAVGNAKRRAALHGSAGAERLAVTSFVREVGERYGYVLELQALDGSRLVRWRVERDAYGAVERCERAKGRPTARS